MSDLIGGAWTSSRATGGALGRHVVRSHFSPGQVGDVSDFNLARPRMNWAARDDLAEEGSRCILRRGTKEARIIRPSFLPRSLWCYAGTLHT